MWIRIQKRRDGAPWGKMPASSIRTQLMDDDETMPEDDQVHVERPVERYRLICGVIERLSAQRVHQVFYLGDSFSFWREES